MSESGVDVAIFCALANEAVAARFGQEEPYLPVKCGTARASIAGWGSLRCLTIASGMGEGRLNRAFKAMMDQYNPRLVINFGAAGALRPGLPVGTPTMPNEVLKYLLPSGKTEGEPIRISSEILCNVSKSIELTRAGTCMGDIRDADIRNRIHRELGVDTTDCETYLVAERCRERRVAFIALRCITDHADAVAGYDYGHNARSVMDRCARLLRPLAEKVLVG